MSFASNRSSSLYLDPRVLGPNAAALVLLMAGGLSVWPAEGVDNAGTGIGYPPVSSANAAVLSGYDALNPEKWGRADAEAVLRHAARVEHLAAIAVPETPYPQPRRAEP